MWRPLNNGESIKSMDNEMAIKPEWTGKKKQLSGSGSPDHSGQSLVVNTFIQEYFLFPDYYF
jgi:hypothetical protein